MTKVSIVIVSYNEEDNIGRCLDSLLELDYPKEKITTIVVDGGSRDKTTDIVKEYPVELLILPGANVATCKNRSLDIIDTKYVAFIDADVIVDRRWLTELVSTISSVDENIAAVGGPNLIMQDDYEMAKLIGHAQETFMGSGGSPQAYSINEMREVISISNCNSLYRYSIVNKHRFDESFNIGDDLEINFRLRLNGYKFIYVPSAIVYHRRPKSLKSLAAKSRVYAKAAAKVSKKYNRIPRWYAIVPSMALISLVISPLTYLLNPELIYIYLLFVLLYFIALLYSTAEVYKSTKRIESLITLIVLPVQHFYYGYGYLQELVRHD